MGWGGSRLRRKECVWRSCPQGSSLQVPTRSPSGPLNDPEPFPPLAPSSLCTSPEGGDCGARGSLGPPLQLTPEKLFWGWELSSTSGPDGQLIRIDAIEQECAWRQPWGLESCPPPWLRPQTIPGLGGHGRGSRQGIHWCRELTQGAT